ncbi:MAG: putative glycosyltransferase [Anaerolineaceae bacterium]|nr:MAG: putative glycosyltransferase [Anaerolineaceae bacterium]
MDTPTFPGKLAIQQRVLTTYRAAFFDALARSCAGGLSVCAGLPRPEESIATTDTLHVARYTFARNIHFLRGPLYLCHQRGLLAWLSGWNPDALIVEANPRYLSTPAAVRWMKRRGRPVIGWGLGAPPSSSPHFWGKWGESQRWAFLRQFDALLTYSRRGADEYAALGFPTDKIFVAPNAAAPRPASPLPSRPPAFTGKPSILFVGRLQARKRVDDLLRACAALPVQPRLVIVGDGPERAALEALARTVYPSAEFVGAKHGPELAPYFSAADLFVLPGTGGLAVQEAISYGLPVIMGAGDGTNDDLVRPGNGWQVPDNDLEALTGTIKQALADAKRLRTMGAESYRIVAEEINLEKMVGVFVEAVKRVKL